MAQPHPYDPLRHKPIEWLMLIARLAQVYLRKRFVRMLLGVGTLAVISLALLARGGIDDIIPVRKILHPLPPRPTQGVRLTPLGPGAIPFSMPEQFIKISREQFPKELFLHVNNIAELSGVRLLTVYVSAKPALHGTPNEGNPADEYIFIVNVTDSERRYVLSPEFNRRKKGMKENWHGIQKNFAQMPYANATAPLSPVMETNYCIFAESPASLSLLESNPLMQTSGSPSYKMRCITQFRHKGQLYFMIHSGTVSTPESLQRFAKNSLMLLHEIGFHSSENVPHGQSHE